MTDLKPTTMPEGLNYWTADEAAECLEYSRHLPPGGDRSLYAKLWSFIAAAENPTPQGGDGTDGTVELPCGRLSADNDDKAPHWWGRLEPAEQAALARAYEADQKEIADSFAAV